jgi:DNA repair exonuclease SbcCD nuclease subunit
MDEPLKDESSEKAAVTLSGIVEKIIKPISPAVPEKAQISVHGAEDLYREIRVENALQDDAGQPVKLKIGAEVAVTIEADKAETTPHAENDSTNPRESKSK